MLEVLISMGLVAAILLALLSCQIAILKKVEQTNFRTIATMQLGNLSDMFFAAHRQSDKTQAFSRWKKDTANLLPYGSGYWHNKSDHVCDIAVTWFFLKKEKETMKVFC